MTKRLLWLTALLLTLGAGTSLATDIPLASTQGISFAQLDFDSQANSSVGMVTVNLLTLRRTTGQQSGYINIRINNNWAVRNLPVFPEDEFPYSQLASEFDLGVGAGTNVASLSASVIYSDQVKTAIPPANPATFQVSAVSFSAGGMNENGIRTAGGAHQPPTMEDVFFGDPANTRATFQLDHPNVEAAKNQCYPASVANSLQFLEDTTDLEIPHDHKPGIKGDNSLVGQLDTHMNRTVVSRTNGSGVNDIPGIQGKLKYLATNGLSDRVRTRHWGKFAGATNVSQTVNSSTATSSAQGATIDFNAVIASLEDGEDCEAAYTYTTSGGGHAIDLVAGGFTNGQPWIIEGSDLNQNSDSMGAGASGFRFFHLTDPDHDGYLNMNGGEQRLDLMICQKYIPLSTPTGTVTPPPGTALVIPGANVTTTSIIDPAGHICCVNPPPAMIDLNFSGGDVILSGAASWLPMTLDINAQGNLSGSNTATVAGFNNVHNSATGTLSADGMNAAITLGTQGELFGVPITFNVTITPDEPWPWSSMPVPPALAPAIRANGFRHDLAIAPGDPLSIDLSLTRGDQSGTADWWVVAQAGSELLSFNLLSGSWDSGLIPTYQGPLFDLPNTPLFSLPTGLPAGMYTLYFGVDRTANGMLDVGTLSYDSVNLNVQ